MESNFVNNVQKIPLLTVDFDTDVFDIFQTISNQSCITPRNHAEVQLTQVFHGTLYLNSVIWSICTQA